MLFYLSISLSIGYAVVYVATSRPSCMRSSGRVGLPRSGAPTGINLVEG